MSVCKISGCTKTAKAKSMCGAHYQQKRRTGNPSPKSTCADWIDCHSTWTGADCLDWPFSKSKSGYGQVSEGKAGTTASRRMCLAAHGKPPTPDYQAAHSCGNRKCVNPKHLRWATAADNCADKRIHGTHRFGQDCVQAKITNADAIMIYCDIRPSRDIAAEYGIDRSTVNMIRRRSTWVDVTASVGTA